MRACLLSSLIWIGFLAPVAAFELSTAKCTNRLDCATRSVVSLLPDWPANFTRNEAPEGSGIVLGDGRLIATADHVLGPAKSARIRTREGRILDARIVMRNQATDIAFLEIEDAQTGFSEPLEVAVGERVCAIGNSFGLDLSLACGVVSATQVSGTGFNPVEDFIQTDAAVNPGMSGGALVDANGNLVGMLSAIFTRQSDANIGVNFAVSSELLYQLVDDFKDDGIISLQRPGVLVRPNNPAEHGGRIGAEIMRVSTGSAEEAGGLKTGDVILQAGDRRIKRAGAYEAAIALAKPGKPLDLIILRGEELMQITINP